jgi:hypothetical protein
MYLIYKDKIRHQMVVVGPFGSDAMATTFHAGIQVAGDNPPVMNNFDKLDSTRQSVETAYAIAKRFCLESTDKYLYSITHIDPDRPTWRKHVAPTLT